jgi:hypothetical protein
MVSLVGTDGVGSGVGDGVGSGVGDGVGVGVDGGFTKTSLDEAGLLLPTELIAVTLHLNPCP